MSDVLKNFISHAVNNGYKISVWSKNNSLICLSLDQEYIFKTICSIEKTQVRIRGSNGETICWVAFSDFGGSISNETECDYLEDWRNSC